MTAAEPSDSTADLFVGAMRSLRRRWADAASPFGLTPHQVRALRVIGRGPLRPGELAEELRVAPRSVTDVVDGLEAAGLLERQPDATDRRAVLLELTPHGSEVLTRVSAARDLASDAWLARLSESDQEELNRLLLLLADND